MLKEIVIVPVKVTPRGKKNVERCVTDGVCLCGCGKPQAKRGLSLECYNQYAYEKRQLPSKKAKAEYDAALIRAGHILESRQITSLKNRSLFSQMAAEVS